MRIGINLSGDLRERMKPLMMVSNISQICRDAIKAYVESYERARERARKDGMEEVADRLAKQLSPPLVDWEAIGIDDAKIWVQLATLEDFENLFHNIAIRKKQGGDLGAFLQYRDIPGTKRFEDHYTEHESWFTRQWELDENTNPHIVAKTEYYNGWFAYVTAVWQMVKERVAAETAAAEKKFKEAKKKSYEEGMKGGNAKAEILAKQ